MGKKNKSKKDRKGVVYSTNPEFEYEYDNENGAETLHPSEQRLRILLDRKHRGGKEVTLVTGFVGTPDDLKALGKELKQKCGVGGSAKEGEIIVQGDQRQKVLDLLKKEGYGDVKLSGG